MIEINGVYRIRKLDQYNLVVEKLNDVEDANTKKIKKEWQIQGYYNSVKNCISYIEKDYMADVAGDETVMFNLKEYYEKISNIKINVEILEKKKNGRKEDNWY